MKIATIVGARPQFVKAAATSRAMRALKVDEVLIHTGQHFDENMSQVFFDELSITKPHYNLNIGGGTSTAMTGKMIEALEEPLRKESPDCVLVFGDTNSTLAGAIAASKLGILSAHVEAGLRSFNRKMPEEINRIAVDHIADLLFPPTRRAEERLKAEGIANERIFFSGDVSADALYFYERVALEREVIATPERYVLATIHRAENTDNPEILREIMEGLKRLAEEVAVVMPLHPRTRKLLEQYQISLGKIDVREPIGYLDMLMLQKNALALATDSGGMQKEAYLLQVPCFTLRTETEWVELVEHGYNELVPLKKEVIPEVILRGIHKKRQFCRTLYGEGNAAEKIIQRIVG